MNTTIGNIHSMETFGLVDGPGVRCVVFLQGCKMRCKYCHNPETWAMTCGGEGSKQKLTGTVEQLNAQELFNKVYRYHNYWKKKGGITVSGGEPLLQLDFVTEFFTLAKQKQVHTALDTSGNPFSMEPEYLEKFDRLMAVTDLFLLDLKAMDGKLHKELTRQPNENILALARYLSDHGKELWIRRVLVPGLTDSKEELIALRSFAATLPTVSRMEVLPYHTLGRFKWENLGLPYELEGVPTPTEDEVKRAKELLGIH